MKTFKIFYQSEPYWIEAKRFRCDEFGIRFIDSDDKVVGFAPLDSVVTVDPDIKK